jgi:hypothetical protein
MRTRLAAVLGSVVLVLGVATAIAPAASAAATITWSGAGGNNNWSTGANWVGGTPPAAGDSIIFPPNAAQPTSNNDIAIDTAFDIISFTGTGYTIGGNPLKATEIGQTSNAVINTTVNLPIHGLSRLRQDGGDGSVMGITGPIVLADTSTLQVSNNQIINITGAISGTGAGINADGAGRVVLSGTNTYTGATASGANNPEDLVINGAQPTSAVTIGGGVLEGTGTVGALLVNGGPGKDAAVFSAGDPIGTIHAGNTTLGSNSAMGIEASSATQYDQLAVTGTVTLSGDIAVLMDFDPAPHTDFTIIDNDGTDAVNGTFAGLPEGAILYGQGGFFKITYKGGSGNDVVLTSLAPPAASIVTGPGSGGGPNVKTFGGRTLSLDAGTGGTGGASVAAGNVRGGQLDDIVVGSGPGVGSQVVIFNSDGTPSGIRFSPYGTTFTGGVSVAVADLNGDGVDEIVTGAGPGGGPNVRIFTGDGTLVGSFFAYDPNFHGGVKVSSTDINDDRVDEIVTGAGPGGGPNVEVFGVDGSLKASFFAYDPNFHGGVNVAGADLDGDGFGDIITGPGPGGGPHVRTFSGGGSPRGVGFFAFDSRFFGGVSVGSIPDFARGHDDIVVGAGPGGGPNVKGYLPDGTLYGSFFAYDGGFLGGVNVAGAALNLPQ